MGSPLSPVIADIVMDHTLTSVTEQLPVRIIGLTKYVDDVFCLVPEGEVQTVLQAFNSYHQKIQFTVELEKERRLPFLDTCITREDTHLESMWYSKPTASDRMLSFYSKHPLKQKVGSAIDSELMDSQQG
ncbi:uncharacterized protein DMENIID0001_000530 [Sergentomyia squamirostris]